MAELKASKKGKVDFELYTHKGKHMIEEEEDKDDSPLIVLPSIKKSQS